jgi:spoIIIJ-associated protein
MDGVEAEGRTVSEATDRALTLLNLRADQVSVEVLSQGRPRLLGFGGEPARVRVTPLADAAPAGETYEEDEGPEESQPAELLRQAPVRPRARGRAEPTEDSDEQPAELLRSEPVEVPISDEDVTKAVAVLEDLLRLMGVDAEVTPRKPETAGDGLGLVQTVLDITGDDLGILIGRRGNTLTSLQYIVNLILSRQLPERVVVGVDVDGYRRRREESIIHLARRTADRVRGTGRSITLEPMPPNERRIVHITLANDPSVMTVSIGEGDGRKVAITPSK